MTTSSTIKFTPNTRPVTRISEPTACPFSASVSTRMVAPAIINDQKRKEVLCVGADVDLAAVMKWVAITGHARSSHLVILCSLRTMRESGKTCVCHEWDR